MTTFKNRLENYFEQLGHILYRHRWKTLLFSSLFIGIIILQIPRVTIDTSSEAMLHENDPSKIVFNQFRDQFGGTNIIFIAITPPKIFDQKFLNQLKALHHDLEQKVPHIKEVTSLINIRNTRGENDTLYADGLLDDWPEKQINLNALKQRVFQNQLYRNHIISPDGRLTAILLETKASVMDDPPDNKSGTDDFEDDFADNDGDEKTSDSSDDNKKKKHYLSQQEISEVVTAIHSVIKNYHNQDFPIKVTGGPVIVEMFNRYTKDDFGFLFVVATSFIVLFLFLLFRRLSGILIPFVIVELATLSMIGIMGILGYSISLFSVVLPSFIVAVGIADAVHILAIFYRNLQNDLNREDAIAASMGHSGVAILMTSLTTAAGLLSFSYSELSALAELGITAAIGVILALIYTIILIPPIVAIFPIEKRKSQRVQQRSLIMDRVLLSFTNLSVKHPLKIIAICAGLTVIAVYFTVKLDFSHDLLKYFPDSLPIKHDILTINESLNGSMIVEVVVDTKKTNGIHDPEILNRIENITRQLVKYKTEKLYVGKIFSINDILKETHQALHDNNPSYYAIPQDIKLIAQEFFLFENSGADDLERIVDSQFSKTRISIKIPWIDLVHVDQFLDQVEEMFQNTFLKTADTTVTGMTAIMGRTIPAAQRSMAKSYTIAFFVISLMMIFLVGSIRYGLLSMAPNLFPIILVMGLMGCLGFEMDLNALMIGSIAIGLVVDDTMHFMYNFRKYYVLTGNTYQAIRETLLGTGRAILVTSLVLCANFFAIMLATLKSALTFGFFTGLVIIVALLSDFVLAPALMVVVTKYKHPGS